MYFTRLWHYSTIISHCSLYSTDSVLSRETQLTSQSSSIHRCVVGLPWRLSQSLGARNANTTASQEPLATDEQPSYHSSMQPCFPTEPFSFMNSSFSLWWAKCLWLFKALKLPAQLFYRRKTSLFSFFLSLSVMHQCHYVTDILTLWFLSFHLCS